MAPQPSSATGHPSELELGRDPQSVTQNRPQMNQAQNSLHCTALRCTHTTPGPATGMGATGRELLGSRYSAPASGLSPGFMGVLATSGMVVVETLSYCSSSSLSAAGSPTS